jgi:hypothetical protein
VVLLLGAAMLFALRRSRARAGVPAGEPVR